ncbi:MAG: alpha-2-macroglobulin [Bacteroidales bacterium]|jgi:uncharacterized protein YfaS (alpha-2-macroglobulin family)|nr:alpha-2-macroglobulin [Bacteroidales bacterium]
MKTHLLTFILIIMATLGFGFSSPSLQNESYDQLWKQVKEADRKDHPKTVVEICDKILAKARKEGNKGQLLKAWFYRVDKKTSITPDTMYSNLKELENWAKDEKDPVTKMVLHSCIASIYSNYAEGNSWEINERTNIDGGEDTPDVEQWGSMKFVKTVLDNVNASLFDIDALRKADNSKFIPFVEQHKQGEYYNHDLLHIITQRAISSLGDIKNVAKDKKAVSDRINEIESRTIISYLNAGNTDAYILSSMDMLQRRLSYREKTEEYVKSLEELLSDEKVKARQTCAEILIELAQNLKGENPAKAMEYCEMGLKNYSGYKRTEYLKEIKENILKPYVNLSLPSFAYPGQEREVNIGHNNLDKVDIIIYKIPESLHDIINKGQTHKLKDEDLKKCTVFSTVTYPLERPADYKTTYKSVQFQIPSEPGIYTFKAVAAKHEIFNWNIMRVGRMKMMYNNWKDRNLEVIVVDRLSGQPIQGAKVIMTKYKSNSRDDSQILEKISDKDGKTIFVQKDEDFKGFNPNVSLKAELGSDIYMPKTSVYLHEQYRGSKDEKSDKLHLLTDRSIYRPGQTVYVKGISYWCKGEDAGIIEGKAYTVILKNHNRETVDKKEVKTNVYGSFETSLQVPTSGLMGTYRIEVQDKDFTYDAATISIEEYKRPTFEVRADRIEGSYKFGDQIEVKANAKTFSGVPLDEADVKYTVTRRKWSWWRMSNETILQEGEARTDEQGNVKIPVTLVPMDEEDDDRYSSSYCSYQVKIDVTNAAGETQSTSTSVYVGKKSLVVRCYVGKEIDKEKDILIRMSVTNLDGTELAKEVSYTLWKDNKGEKGEKVKEGKVQSNTSVNMDDWKALPSGRYIITYSVKDDKGEVCEGETSFAMFSVKDGKPLEGSYLWTYRDGDKIWFGTSQKDAVIYMDVYSDGKNVESKVFRLSDKLLEKNFAYIPEYKDGASIYFRMVRDDQFFQTSYVVTKPSPDNRLRLKWSVFRNTLIPGQAEQWTLNVVGPDGKPADAEVLALMYDASLDKIRSHYLSTISRYYPRHLTYANWQSTKLGFFGMSYSPYLSVYVPDLDFDTFINLPYIISGRRRHVMYRALGAKSGTVLYDAMVVEDSAAPMANAKNADYLYETLPVQEDAAAKGQDDDAQPQAKEQEQEPQLRTNFNETAFFLPQLVTDKDGNVAISFTLPESLTRWRFMSMAHTKDLKTGYLQDEIEAKKDFMIAPNMPRFLRNGDITTISSALTNLSEKDIEANVRFELFDIATEKVFHTESKKVQAAAGKTSKVSFSFPVEDTYDVIGVRIIAEGGEFSDGEQHSLAVLSDKVRIVESVALPIRGEQKKEFSLESLFNHHSPSATKKTLTIEFTGNPAWYAIQALPSLAEPDDDCAICWTNALYANVLASKIANSQPKIKSVYEAWKKSGQNKETLLSNLQKNQELKTILLSESPWVLEAKSEEDQKMMISTLFDVMNIRNIGDKAIKKLGELQMGDGGWTWFKGMESSPWITEYVLTQDIRLRILTGENLDGARNLMHSKGLAYMHNEAQKEYDWIMKEKVKTKGVSYFILKYLYLVALEAQADGKTPADIVPKNRKTMYNFFLNKVAEVPKSQDMQEKSMAAVVLKANGKQKLADEYIQSIREHLTSSEEMGMYFAFNENPYRWGSLNLNAQVAAIEAFDQVAGDMQTVEEMKIWLLKQKQTQMWGTSTLTADAIFALLARGDNWLASEGVADLTFAGRTVSTNKPDEEGNAPIPGLNYIKRAYTDSEATDARTITVEKKDKGIAWGAAYATFFEKMSNVKDNSGKEMSITKELFVKRVNKVSESGNKENRALSYTLEPLKNGAVIKVGDIVTARMVIKIDRRMDFVQLKEQRGACFEPMTQLSGYHYGGGTGYYEEIKDASTNFFFYSLGKGTYVLEVNYRASRAGEYEAGLANLQCAYAPEYTAHTSSTRITVEDK